MKDFGAVCILLRGVCTFEEAVLEEAPGSDTLRERVLH